MCPSISQLSLSKSAADSSHSVPRGSFAPTAGNFTEIHRLAHGFHIGGSSHAIVLTLCLQQYGRTRLEIGHPELAGQGIRIEIVSSYRQLDLLKQKLEQDQPLGPYMRA
jgi:hypothetical protein